MSVEGGVAWKYWNEFSKVVPDKYDFCSRIDQYRRPVAAGDMANVMLNYGYALLEAECLRAINTVGTLHYMKQNSKADKPFTLNKHVKERLEMWEGIKSYTFLEMIKMRLTEASLISLYTFYNKCNI